MESPSTHAPVGPARDATRGVLKIDLRDLDVRHASETALSWLGMPADRVLGRSLMLSVPPLGQALTVALAAGLGPDPRPLPVALATPGQHRLTITALRLDSEAVIELRQADDLPSDAPRAAPDAATTLAEDDDHAGLLRRLTALRDELARLRVISELGGPAPGSHAPLGHWLWQAEEALTRMSERFDEVRALARRLGDSPQADRL